MPADPAIAGGPDDTGSPAVEEAVDAAVALIADWAFDGLMVAVRLFDYDESRSLGVTLLGVPLEDFAWPVAAALGLPSAWRLAGADRP